MATNEQLSSDKLPDLVRPDLTESNNYSSVLDTVPPIGEHPPDNIFDGCTTEEEFDAVDALLSLGNVRDTVTENSLEENSSLMPIDGNSKYQDINPVTVHLDQVSVDRAIAQIVEKEGMSAVLGTGTPDSQPVNSYFTSIQVTTPTNEEVCDKMDVNNITLSGVQSTLSGGQSSLSGVHIAKENSEGPKKIKSVIVMLLRATLIRILRAMLRLQPTGSKRNRTSRVTRTAVEFVESGNVVHIT